MNKVIWVNFLHMYQPPWQSDGVIDQVSIESYEYLATLFEKYAHFRASLNITGSLVEQLARVRPDVLSRLQTLVKSGQLELVASAQYHPILPLISVAEVKRQIELNQETVRQYFSAKKIRGFYLPEMAFSMPVAKIVKSYGYQWIILDEIHYPKAKVDYNILYKIKKIGLKVVFRERRASKQYPPRVVADKLARDKEDILVTATDAEIYGHFHEDWRGFVEKILKNKRLAVLTVSDYLAKLKKVELVTPRNASWETSRADLKKHQPYSLWQDPKNSIHQSLWSLVDLASQLVAKYKKDKNWRWARQHLDRGLSSCTFWWATAKKPSPFSPLTWNPDMIDNGSEELIRAVRSLDKATAAEKIKAEKIYIAIKKDTWIKHWRKYNK